MTPLRPRTELATHVVENQPPERGDLDLWGGDRPLREAVARAGGAAHAGGARRLRRRRRGARRCARPGGSPTASRRSSASSTAAAGGSTRWRSIPPITR